MAPILYLLIGLTALLWLTRFLGWHKICPICAAVTLTWIGGAIIYKYLPDLINPLMLAVLAGASLGALSEKYGFRLGIVWKTVWTVAGALGIFWLVTGEYMKGFSVLIFVLLLTTVFSFLAKSEPAAKDIFKECC